MLGNAAPRQRALEMKPQLLGDGDPAVVDGRCLEDEPHGAEHAHDAVGPEEETVDHQRHVLPVLARLKSEARGEHC